ncbi:FAD-binding oxidoreductase [Streptomyces sp. NPDC005811]|uniref:FAD-binding oxidoreductase n=1 Tax=Streptomyces sp. NPDC005811 TaxID=3154565 RepID=UPI0033E484CF
MSVDTQTATVGDGGYLSEKALRRFTDVLGEDGVVLDEGRFHEQYRDKYWHRDDDTYDPAAVLLPRSTEEVQAVVRIANEFGVPIWTSSQGRNYGYGGSSPRLKATVVVSLTRMNRVLEINRELAYAVVEPGVRWFDLYDALKESGNEDLMVTVPDLGWGSVIGNSLDCGITYQPYGADFMAPCGMEVVLANGELLRTGMGAIPDNKSWHTYKRGLGPVLDGLFVQSNFGIVTRMGYWLMPRPEAYAPFFLTVPRDEHLEQAVDIMRRLRLDGTLRGVPSMYNTVTLAAQFPEVMGRFAGAEGAFSEETLDEMADATGLGRWALRGALWGDGPVVEHQLAKIRAAWSAIPGGQVLFERTYGPGEYDEIRTIPDKCQAGLPGLDLIEAIPEGIAHIGFSPAVPLVGTDVREVVDLFDRIVREQVGVNVAGGLLIINERTALYVTGLNYDYRDAEQCRRAYDAVKVLVAEAGRRGYGEYRAHLDFMDLASAQYSFNNHAYRRFCETVKDAVDPNGILSPGRHGIWPERFRHHADRD